MSSGTAAATTRSGPSASTEPEKSFVCEKCGRVFNKKANLKVHSRKHTGERPYSCSKPGCGRSFMWKSSVTFHEQNCPSTRKDSSSPASTQSSSPSSSNPLANLRGVQKRPKHSNSSSASTSSGPAGSTRSPSRARRSPATRDRHSSKISTRTPPSNPFPIPSAVPTTPVSPEDKPSHNFSSHPLNLASLPPPRAAPSHHPDGPQVSYVSGHSNWALSGTGTTGNGATSTASATRDNFPLPCTPNPHANPAYSAATTASGTSASMATSPPLSGLTARLSNASNTMSAIGAVSNRPNDGAGFGGGVGITGVSSAMGDSAVATTSGFHGRHESTMEPALPGPASILQDDLPAASGSRPPIPPVGAITGGGALSKHLFPLHGRDSKVNMTSGLSSTCASVVSGSGSGTSEHKTMGLPTPIAGTTSMGGSGSSKSFKLPIALELGDSDDEAPVKTHGAPDKFFMTGIPFGFAPQPRCSPLPVCSPIVCGMTQFPLSPLAPFSPLPPDSPAHQAPNPVHPPINQSMSRVTNNGT